MMPLQDGRRQRRSLGTFRAAVPDHIITLHCFLLLFALLRCSSFLVREKGERAGLLLGPEGSFLEDLVGSWAETKRTKRYEEEARDSTLDFATKAICRGGREEEGV